MRNKSNRLEELFVQLTEKEYPNNRVNANDTELEKGQNNVE